MALDSSFHLEKPLPSKVSIGAGVLSTLNAQSEQLSVLEVIYV